jgi:hypothetical protein
MHVGAEFHRVLERKKWREREAEGINEERKHEEKGKNGR